MKIIFQALIAEKIKWTIVLAVDVCDNFDDEMIHSRQRSVVCVNIGNEHSLTCTIIIRLIKIVDIILITGLFLTN